jgi:hypothetical protein
VVNFAQTGICPGHPADDFASGPSIYTLRNAGIVLGAVSLATGVGEITGASVAIGELTLEASDLGAVSFATGVGGSFIDANRCFSGDAAACVGLSLSVPGVIAGILGLVAEGLLSEAVLNVLKYIGVATGALGYGWDSADSVAGAQVNGLRCE